MLQRGPLIVDNRGDVVWFKALPVEAADFRVQRYRGRPALTWWQGRSKFGVGQGEYVIVDQSYRTIATVRAGNGLAGDLHEFVLTPRGSALVVAYAPVAGDVSRFGGPKKGKILDSVFQEVDVASGRVLFEWHSVGHVALDDSYWKLKKTKGKFPPYDYFHINSVDVAANGNYLVSARNTHALYEIDRRSGKVLWRLGGKKSDFELGKGTEFNWQHDARWHGRETISVFDNGAFPKVEDYSRALILRVDLRRRKVTLERAFVHPDKILSRHQGSMQLLPNGDVFVGWGSEPIFTEFDRSGNVVFDARFGPDEDSYRALRFPWVGRPTNRPSLSVSRSSNGHVRLYASWNGATEVARWRVLAGSAPGRLRAIATADKNGFETRLSVQTSARYFAVGALDRTGGLLGTSTATKGETAGPN